MNIYNLNFLITTLNNFRSKIKKIIKFETAKHSIEFYLYLCVFLIYLMIIFFLYYNFIIINLLFI